MGDLFNIDSEDIQRRMDELVAEELGEARPVSLEPPPEPVQTLDTYRGMASTPDATKASWVQRCRRWLGWS